MSWLGRNIMPLATQHRRHLTILNKYRTLCRPLSSSNGWTSIRSSGLSIICQGLTSSTPSPSTLRIHTIVTLFASQVARSPRAEKTVVAVPRQVPDVVPAARQAGRGNRRVRARAVLVLRLGGKLVRAQEERLPIRVSEPERGVNSAVVL
jgi:hypothetical protein